MGDGAGMSVAGRIVIALQPDGSASLRFEGMKRPPMPAERLLPSIDVARNFAILMHQAHGWSIFEEYPDEKAPPL